MSNATRTAREEPIFDSDVRRGNVYTMERKMSGDDAFSAIEAYTPAIRPVGNDASQFTYLDKSVEKWWTQMPSDPNWAEDRMKALAGVKKDLALDDEMMEDTFRNVTKEQAAVWLWMVHSQRDHLRNNPHTALIDPFLVEMTLTRPKAKSKPWVITTQFANSAMGYITRVVAGDKDVTGSIVTSGEFRAERGNAAKPEEFLFSSTHEGGPATFGERVETLAGWKRDDQKGRHAGAFDAITWIAAEGARFEPVRQLGRNATPATPLYMKPGPGQAKCVTVHWLMQNWGKHFGRRYGITAEEVASKVAGEGTSIKAVKGVRYNLTKKRVEP